MATTFSIADAHKPHTRSVFCRFFAPGCPQRAHLLERPILHRLVETCAVPASVDGSSPSIGSKIWIRNIDSFLRGIRNKARTID